MKSLVTGAAGFIGSALIQRLILEDHNIKGLYHKQKPRQKSNNITYVQGEITDKKSIKGITKDIDIIFHCAGIVNDYSSKNEYYTVHVNGTKNLIEECKTNGCKRFIYLSHIPYESNRKKHPYQKTKSIAESLLLSEYKKNGFPAIIIRPGNVYGPNASTWVIRPLQAIKKNRIALINKGTGIFLHTYIDNLIDALLLTIEKQDIEGEIFEITDGDNTITWGKYLNDLSKIIGKGSINRSIPKPFALFLGKIMLLLYPLTGIKPMITPSAVEIFSNSQTVSIKKAQKVLNYTPQISYSEGMDNIQRWITEKGIENF